MRILHRILFCQALLFLLIFVGCKKKETIQEFVPNTGQIQILNGCGISGAAEKMRNFLSEFGFDIVEFGNAQTWNFDETLIIARTEDTRIAEDLSIILKTTNWVQIKDSTHMVSATVIVGKDFHQKIYDTDKIKRPTSN